METDKSNLLVKIGLAVTTGLSAVFTAYLVSEQIRKFKKQKEKLDFKKIESEIEKQILQVKQEATFSQAKELLPKRQNSYQSKKSHESFKYDIYKIVLTGGPCAGKTTAMTYISNKLRERGINVLIVPEFATLIANGGGFINAHKMKMSQLLKLQSIIMKGIMALEDHFVELAENFGGRTVILCDRGVMDGKAYISPEGWQVLLDENGYNLVNLRDKRYDAVIHLVTAADGAEEFYSLENNVARYESTKELAIQTDRKIRDAWVGHPLLVIADNHQGSFDKKIMKVYETVLHVVGLPNAPKFYRKFLLNKDYKCVDGIPVIPETYQTETVLMEDTFLRSHDPKLERKLRKRGLKDSFIYIYSTTQYNKPRDEMTDKDFENDGVECKRQITAREYILLFEEKDPKRKTLEKVRQSFVYEGELFCIDTFLDGKNSFSLLNIEATKDLAGIKMPSFISIEKDVTDKLEYTTYNVARIEK